jgi:hypothetical protein
MPKLHIRDKFGVIPNELLNNPNISLKAKWLFWFMQGKPDWWNFSVDRIAMQCMEWERAIRSAMKELEEHWYLTREPYQKENWDRWGYNYTLFSNPDLASLHNARTHNARTQNASTQNRHTFSKKEYSKKELVKKNKNDDEKNIQDQDFQEEDIQKQHMDEDSIIDASDPGELKLAKSFISAKQRTEEIKNVVNSFWYETDDIHTNEKTARSVRTLQQWQFANIAEKYDMTPLQLAIMIINISMQDEFRAGKIIWSADIQKHYWKIIAVAVKKKNPIKTETRNYNERPSGEEFYIN